MIAVSASVFDFDKQQSQEVGCDDFLPKPIKVAELLEKLRVHLGLEWIYEQQEMDQSGTTGNSQLPNASHLASPTDYPDDSVVKLPTGELAILLDLAMRGDLRGVAKRASHLEELDKSLVPFATHLRQLANGFKGKQILEFLKKF